MTRITRTRRALVRLAYAAVSTALSAACSTDVNGTMDAPPADSPRPDGGGGAGSTAPPAAAIDGGNASLPDGAVKPLPTPGADAGAGSTDAAPGSGGGSGGGSGATIPPATGPCPELTQGSVTFSPAGIPPRAVQIYMSDAAKQKHGPLLIYWHGTGSQPGEAQYALGSQLNAITAAGGIVAAPNHDPNAGQFPWYGVSGTKDDDLRVADEIVACAMQKVGIDAHHIHTLGMSAGGLQTSLMSFARSSYLASVVTFSGGIAPGSAPHYEDPSNKFAAMIFDGGPNDKYGNFDFQAASEAYRSKLVGDGHFAFICDHGNGHAIPTDAAASVWAFFQAHAFGTDPSPYKNGLPPGFPGYCSL